MKKVRKVTTALRALRAGITGRKDILAVRWQVTERCPLRCSYCNIWKNPDREPNRNQALQFIRELGEARVRRLSISGGEPLLYPLLPEVIRAANREGIDVSINTSGWGLPLIIDKLKPLKLVKISLDGPEEVHDRVRGQKGAWKKAMEAADACREAGIKYSFACTLTSHSIPFVEYVRSLAESRNTIAAFQPVKKLYRGLENLDGLAPDPDAVKKAVDNLIELKRAGHGGIRNSIAGLYHIRNWPVYEKVRCAAGRLFVIVNLNGTVTPCDRMAYNDLPNAYVSGFQNAINELPAFKPCGGCGFAGSLELSYLMNFNFSGVMDIGKFL